MIGVLVLHLEHHIIIGMGILGFIALELETI